MSELPLNGVLLTADQVVRWKAERDRLQHEIDQRQAELNVINRKLEAVEILTTKRETSTKPEASLRVGRPTRFIGDLSGVSLPDAIVKVLQSSVAPLSPSEIKDRLIKNGYAKTKLGNYFYTSIRRLIKRGRVTKQGNRYLPATKIDGREDDPQAQPGLGD